MSSKAVDTIRARVPSEVAEFPTTAGAPLSSQLWAPLFDFFALFCITAFLYFVLAPPVIVDLPPFKFLTIAAILCLFEVLVCKRLAFYAPLPTESAVDTFKVVFKAQILTQLLEMSSLYMTNIGSVHPGLVFTSSIVSFVWLCFSRQVRGTQVQQHISAGLLTRNALIVGYGEVGLSLRDHFRKNPNVGYFVRGFIDDSACAPEILGTTADLERVIRTQFIDHIYITTYTDRSLVKMLTMRAPTLGVDLTIVPDLFDGIGWGAPVDRVGHFPVIVLHRRHAYALQRLVKRIVDAAGSFVLLMLTAPFLALIAVAIKKESPGPVLYRATRVGHKGRIFCCYKFRTMFNGSDRQLGELAHLNERSAPLFKIRNDPRITPLGRWLRRYSLDELPQLMNVLRGEMSLVGPRPPALDEYREFTLEHLRKLEVLPGITGLWQVTARTDPSFQSYIRCDLEYIEHWSLFLDFEILARTVLEVLRGTGS